MTRHLLWAATTFTVVVSLLAYDNTSLAQQTEEATADAEEATDDPNAGASADADTGEASGEADVQATSDSASAQSADQATADSDSSPSETEAATTNEANDPQVPPPARATNDPQRTPSDATDAQAAQDAGPALPAPSSPSDPNSPREQSRLRDSQQLPADRGRTTVQGRANVDARRDRERDLRVGIQFGRVTDRGLTINHIDRNNFFFSSGFRRGDVIVSVHGRPVRRDADFFRFVVLRPGERVPVVVLRDGRRETIYVVYRDVAVDRRINDSRQYQPGGAYLGVTFDTQYRDVVVVANVNPGSPAQEAGLQPGDILVALNGREVRSYPEAISVVRAMRPGDELEIIVERARAERQVVAVLDAPPTVRTAARPPVQLERQTITSDQPEEVRVDVDDRDENGRLLDRNRDNDRGRDRLLPRLRD